MAPPSAQDIVCELSDTSVLAFSGPDAVSFLHGQLTSDVAGLAADHSQYSGYCTPKGRLLASFLLWRNGDEILLELPTELTAGIRKRISMYVLRSKVVITDATQRYTRLGLAGPGAAAAVEKITGVVPDAVHSVAQREGRVLLHLPGNRFEVLLPASEAATTHPVTTELSLKTISYWNSLRIAAGIPVITPATQEEFVPQMVNFDLIGAVSFAKGCYPGQEIVARMHYLGRLKQRMYRVHIDAPARPQPGDKVYGGAFGEQASGMIVNAEPVAGGGFEALAVLQTESAAEGALHCGSSEGPLLRLLPLPYTG